jgi:hypothetical protein
MFAVFPVMRQLHEALWHLGYAADRCPPGPLRDELRTAVRDSTALTAADEATLRQLDLPTHWRQVAGLLRRAGAALRAASGFDGPHHRGADLAGRDLRRRELRGASLRGALLIGADLQGMVLTGTDLRGTDLRGARLQGTDLTGALFVTQPQLAAATGGRHTRLPAELTRPGHWPGS